jgi:hypothetical protein
LGAVTAPGIARYDDLLRPVADGRPDGFCKLIAELIVREVRRSIDRR